MEFWQIALAVASILVSGGAVYGGIRSELKGMHERQVEHGQQIALIQREGCGPCLNRRKGD